MKPAIWFSEPKMNLISVCQLSLSKSRCSLWWWPSVSYDWWMVPGKCPKTPDAKEHHWLYRYKDISCPSNKRHNKVISKTNGFRKIVIWRISSNHFLHIIDDQNSQTLCPSFFAYHRWSKLSNSMPVILCQFLLT
jgi:hypothetical protein